MYTTYAYFDIVPFKFAIIAGMIFWLPKLVEPSTAVVTFEKKIGDYFRKKERKRKKTKIAIGKELHLSFYHKN